MHRHDCQPKTGKTTIQQIAEPGLGQKKQLQQKSDQEKKTKKLLMSNITQP